MSAAADPLMALAAAALAGAAGWVQAGARAPARRLERGGSRLRARVRRRGWKVAAVLAALPIAALTGPVPVTVAVLAGYVLARRARSARQRRDARTARSADLLALRALAAELGSGLPPPEALRVAAGPAAAGALRERMLAAAEAEALGGDGAPALRGEGEAGAAAGALAAAWAVCQRSGSSLAAPVSRIAGSAAADLRVMREVDAALAAARASARLLAVLPFAGVALGQLSGAGSLRVLFLTGAGQACLLLGTVLDLAGLAWLDRLADAAGG